MTPLAMEMLIWWHCRPFNRNFPNIRSSAQQEQIKQFLADGVIEGIEDNRYQLTALGTWWLFRALDTPMPSTEVAGDDQVSYVEPDIAAVIYPRRSELYASDFDALPPLPHGQQDSG